MKKVVNFIFAVLAAFWMLLVLSEYFQEHKYYFEVLSNFRYWNLIIFLIIFIVLFLSFFGSITFKEKFQIRDLKINGFKILGFISGLASIILISYGMKTNLFSEQSFFIAMFNFLIKFWYVIFGIYFVVLTTFVLGSFVLKLIKIKLDKFKKYTYSIAFGICSLVTLVLIFGMLGFLKNVYLWPIIVVILGISYKKVFEFIETTLVKNYPVKKIDLKTLFFLTILLVTFTFSLVDIIRPIPIGWDDMRVYMNIAKIISNTGNLVSGFGAYNWSIFMSLGFVLFGSTEIAMGLSFLGVILSSCALYILASKFLGVKSNLALSSLIFSLPSFIFLSRKDMKIDLGLLFMSLVILNLFFDWIKQEGIKKWISLETVNGGKCKIDKKKSETDKKIEIKTCIGWKNFILILLIGSLLGFAFGIKYTSFILIVSITAIFAFIFFKYWGVLLVAAGSIYMVFQLDLLSLQGIQFETQEVFLIKIFSILLIFIAVLYLFIKRTYRQIIFPAIKVLAILGLGVFLGFSPWIVKNAIETKEINMSAILYGKNEKLRFNVKRVNREYKQLYIDEAETKNGINKLENKLKDEPTGTYELVTLYSGYEEGLLRYLTLPWDVVMTSNVNKSLVHVFDIGPLLLFILPIQIFLLLKRKNSRVALMLLTISTIGFLMLSFISVKGISMCEGGLVTYECMLESISDYQTNAGFISSSLYSMFMYTLPVLFPFYSLLSSLDGFWIILSMGISTFIYYFFVKRFLGDRKKILYIFVFLGLYLPLWLILGNGLYWYGMLGFVLLFMIMLIFQNMEQEDFVEKVFLNIFKYSLYIWLSLAFLNIFFVGAVSNIQILNPVFAEYMIGNKTSEQAKESLNSSSYKAIKILNTDSEAKIYKVGTMLEYFIEKGQNRIYEDRSLETFKLLHNSSQTKEEIAKKMRLAGYKYLLVSFANTNLDETKQRTLENKYDALREFTLENKKLKPLKTDQLVLDQEDGEILTYHNNEEVHADFGFEGDVIKEGSFYLFEIFE